ncbi:hypothetical protein CPB86DRAFT_802638 [Serendipita vermifera]|nr:hypothetical protein CPB86DRAFT_802638 [Serendipita vermifera]
MDGTDWCSQKVPVRFTSQSSDNFIPKTVYSVYVLLAIRQLSTFELVMTHHLRSSSLRRKKFKGASQWKTKARLQINPLRVQTPEMEYNQQEEREIVDGVSSKDHLAFNDVREHAESEPTHSGQYSNDHISEENRITLQQIRCTYIKKALGRCTHPFSVIEEGHWFHCTDPSVRQSPRFSCSAEFDSSASLRKRNVPFEDHVAILALVQGDCPGAPSWTWIRSRARLIISRTPTPGSPVQELQLITPVSTLHLLHQDRVKLVPLSRHLVSSLKENLGRVHLLWQCHHLRPRTTRMLSHVEYPQGSVDFWELSKDRQWRPPDKRGSARGHKRAPSQEIRTLGSIEAAATASNPRFWKRDAGSPQASGLRRLGTPKAKFRVGEFTFSV